MNKREMITQKIDHRVRKNKDFSFSIFPLGIFIVLLLLLLVLPTQPTSKVISTLSLDQINYHDGESLNGSLILNLTTGDLLPKDTNVTFKMMAQDPFYYVCENGYDYEWEDINGTLLSDQPWYDFCNELDQSWYNCTDYNKTCCEYGVTGKVYGNLLCQGRVGLCGDKNKCSVRNIFTLSDIIKYSTTPDKGNFTNGTFKNNNLLIGGSGEGIGYCFNTSEPSYTPYISTTCNDSDGNASWIQNTCHDLSGNWSDACVTDYTIPRDFLSEKYCKQEIVNVYPHCSICSGPKCLFNGTQLEGWYCTYVEMGHFRWSLIDSTNCTGLNVSIYGPKCQNDGTWLLAPSCASEMIPCISCTGNPGMCSGLGSCSGWNNQYSIPLQSLFSQGIKTPAETANYSLIINFNYNPLFSPYNNSVLNFSIASSFIVLQDIEHKACNINNQCVSVDGEGSDECSNNSDCGCVSSWNCSDWGPAVCTSGWQYRTCIDLNGCDPQRTESRTCSVPCVSSWSCSWQNCNNGLQDTVCRDIYTCNPNNSSYVFETRDCCTEDWICDEWSSCENGEQTRTCQENIGCGTEFDKPIETQICEKSSGIFIWILIIVIIVAFLLILRKTLFKPRINRSSFFSPGSGPGLPPRRTEFMHNEPSMLEISRGRKTKDYHYKLKELIDYIKRSLRNGLSKKEIEKILLQKGWPMDKIDEAFNSLFA